MSRKITHQNFMERAIALYGDKYDLSRVQYVATHAKIEVVCREHGGWLITPANFLNGKGCPRCGAINRAASKTLTQEQFLEKVKEVHGEKYDLSEAVYTGRKVKVKVICGKHGPFWIVANNLFMGNGCPECGSEKRKKSLTSTTEAFIEKAKKVHGDKYDYSLVDYVSAKTKVRMVCPKHGEWMAEPNGFLCGRGCPKCGYERIGEKKAKSPEQFILDAISIHGDKYDLSETVYSDNKTKVKVICYKHGPWWVTPNNFLRGRGCPGCRTQGNKERFTSTTEEFIEKAQKVHGDRFDYSQVDYQGAKPHVTIICPVHGPFSMSPGNHLMGQGCAKCSGKAKPELDDLITRFKEVHGGKYDYSKVRYENANTKVQIVCPEHGVFEQIPGHHLNGCGCPRCSIEKRVSVGENEVADYLESLGMVVERGRRDLIAPKELDMFIPTKNLAVEYDGAYFHSDLVKSPFYHYEKHRQCAEKGIRLIRILDVVWEERKEQVKAILANAVGAREGWKKVDARKCRIREVPVGGLKNFYDQNHIQGHCRTGSLALALFFEGEIVAAMVFGKGTNQRGPARRGKEGEWTLSRYATSCVVRGGFQKLLKHGRDLIGWEHDIISFSANDFFGGGAYEAAGFELDALLPPTYQVYHRKTGLRPKSHWQRKNIPLRLLDIGVEDTFDPETDPRTEREMEDMCGALRIWDCGMRRWRLRGVTT
ncbi:MAG: hypothetical protein K0041_06775 [Acidithiobacillus sp.]|nr:hypothetical protein [Acidithiobacillus sp.]